MTEHCAAARRILGSLLEERTGQQLVAGRQWRIETALKPVARALGLASVDALVSALVKASDPSLGTRVVEALLNNETSFFRDAGAFAILDGTALERLRTARQATKRLRIWSAGCSTGQEAYSIAMLLRARQARWTGWSIGISATDVSEAAVARAKAGRYSQFEVQRGLPARTMLDWFEQDGVDWVIAPALRRMVRFATHNLILPPPGQFDVVLCRNVLMYFAPTVRRAVFERLYETLAPDGVLMLGAGETVIGQTTRFVSDTAMRGLYTVARGEGNATRRVA